MIFEGKGSGGINNPDRWSPAHLNQAFEYVGGPNQFLQFNEPLWVAEMMGKRIKSNSLCVEFGCGFGRILLPLANILKDREVKIVGVDFNDKMLELARTYTLKYPEISYLSAEPQSYKTALENSSVDFLFSHAVMIHNNPKQIVNLFSEFTRILKTGGRMIHDFLNENNRETLQEIEEASKIGFPLYIYTHQDIQKIAQQFNLNSEQIGDALARRVDYIFTLIG